MLKIVKSKNIKRDFIDDVLKLDALVYDQDMQGSYESVNKRFQKNKDSYLLIMDASKIVGYICFFPISKSLEKKMLEGDEIQDDNISPNDILEYTKGKSHDLFIISIVIHPDYRDQEAIKLLTSEFVSFINKKIKTNFHINKVYASAVSSDGEKVLEYLNFKKEKTYQDGYKLYASEKVRLNTENNYKKTYKSDMYIMVPYCSTRTVDIKDNEKDDLANEFIKSLHYNATYECNNNVTDNLKRVSLGKNKLACLDDEYDGVAKGQEEIYLFLTSHSQTGMHILTLMNLSNEYSPTQIQDQVTTNNLFIYDDNDNLIHLDEYMKANYHLERCGNAKVLLSISNIPKDPLEFEYMLASESFNSRRVDYKLDSKEFKEMCQQNVSQYDFYELYASRDAVIYVLHTFDDNLMTNIMDEAPILFIMELIMFQSAAILRTNNKIVEQLSKSGSVNISFIESLYREFGKTIKFWSKDVFNYSAVQNLSTTIHKAFETEKIKDDYYTNQRFLEHIVNLRDVQDSNRESKILNRIVLLLTAMQVLPITISFINWLGSNNSLLEELSKPQYTISFSTILLLLIVVLINRKKMKKKRDSLQKF